MVQLVIGNFVISLITFLTCFLQPYLKEAYQIGIIMAANLAISIILMRYFMAMQEETDGNEFLETKHSNALGALFMVTNVLTVVYINLNVSPLFAIALSVGYFIDLSKMIDFGLHGITLGSEIIEIQMIDKFSFNFYHGILCSLFIICDVIKSDISDAVLYCLCVLPFLYFFRILPDVSLVPLVFMEKLQIHIFGGSACYSKLKLLKEFSKSVLLNAAAYTIYNFIYPSFGLFMICLITPLLAADWTQYIYNPKIDMILKPPFVILIIYSLSTFSLMVSPVMDFISSTQNFLILKYMTYVLIAIDLLLAAPTLAIFILRLSPLSLKIFSKNISNTIYYLNSPFLTVFCLAAWRNDTSNTSNLTSALLLFLAGGKVIRQSWTTPISLLHSLIIYHLINYFGFSKILYDDTALIYACSELYPAFKRLLDNLGNIIRFSFAFISHCFKDKERKSFSISISIFGLPWNLFVAIVAAILDATFSPLYGLPFFWLDISRSAKFFWNIDDEDGRNVDSAMYSNFSNLIKQSIHKNYIHKIIGSEGNNCLLIRNDYLSYFVQTIEVGYGYAVFQFKGLELESTSCHNREIVHIDETIKKQKIISWSGFNIFHPIGTLELMTMELNFIRLSGYNSRDFLVKFFKNFNASLIWVFGHLTAFNLGFYKNLPPETMLFKPCTEFESKTKSLGLIFPVEYQNLFYHIVNSYSIELRSYQESALDFWLPELYDFDIVTDYLDEFCRTVRSIEKPVSLALKYAIISTVQQMILGKEEMDYAADFTEFQSTYFLHLRMEEDIEDWYKAASRIPKEVYCISKKMYTFGLDENEKTNPALLILKRKIGEVQVVQINTSTAKSIWSNLLFEVGYLGVTDEERYSLQSEEHYLRNTLSQLAHYPYGWTAFSSVFKIDARDLH
eukprot:NODE_68_length_25399_cov_0.885771.p2 type:complete len:902 gc:universal NODE_68_length_25399_cov_0.885771:4048-1343(-)